jgi:hypothetical protein
MQAPPPGPPSINLAPPIKPDVVIAILLIIAGSMIEIIPEQYHSLISNPLVFLTGMILSAGLAAMNYIPIAFAVAFFLVNLLRIMPKKTIKKTITKTVKISNPGSKEGFEPSGAIDWVTNNKKWFVEKVLMERPVGIQEKEVSTYPVQA